MTFHHTLSLLCVYSLRWLILNSSKERAHQPLKCEVGGKAEGSPPYWISSSKLSPALLQMALFFLYLTQGLSLVPMSFKWTGHLTPAVACQMLLSLSTVVYLGRLGGQPPAWAKSSTLGCVPIATLLRVHLPPPPLFFQSRGGGLLEDLRAVESCTQLPQLPEGLLGAENGHFWFSTKVMIFSFQKAGGCAGGTPTGVPKVPTRPPECHCLPRNVPTSLPVTPIFWLSSTFLLHLLSFFPMQGMEGSAVEASRCSAVETLNDMLPKAVFSLLDGNEDSAIRANGAWSLMKKGKERGKVPLKT